MASTPATQPSGEVVEKGSCGDLAVDLPGVESLAELGDKPNTSLKDKEKKRHHDHRGSRSHHHHHKKNMDGDHGWRTWKRSSVSKVDKLVGVGEPVKSKASLSAVGDMPLGSRGLLICKEYVDKVSVMFITSIPFYWFTFLIISFTCDFSITGCL